MLSGGVKIDVFKYKGENVIPFQLDRVGRAGVRRRRTQGTLWGSRASTVNNTLHESSRVRLEEHDSSQVESGEQHRLEKDQQS